MQVTKMRQAHKDVARAGRGQASTEYMIVIAICLLVALVALAVITTSPPPGTGNAEKASMAYWESAYPITIRDAGMQGDTTLVIVVRNNGMQPVAIAQNDVNATEVR